MNTYVYCKDWDYAQFKSVLDHTPLEKDFYSSEIEIQANIQLSDEHNTFTIRLQILRGCYSDFAHEESHYFDIHNEFVIFFHSLLFISSVYYRSLYDEVFLFVHPVSGSLAWRMGPSQPAICEPDRSSRLPQLSGVDQRMKKFRPIFAAIIALLFYTVTDILVWQRIFEANQMIQHANTYHTGWFVSLAGYVTIGIILLWDKWRDCLYFVSALLVGAYSGLEDVLYYVLDRKPIPDSLPWLDNNPMIYQVSRTGLLTSVLFWILVLIAFYIILYEWKGFRKKTIARTDKAQVN